MRWDASQIARLATQVGFGPADVVTATALALATSGGIDHYDYRPGAPGSGRYVGLWGIDTDRYDYLAGQHLEVPSVSAQAVRELTRDAGGWEWSPVYNAGHWQAYRSYAGTERTKAMAVQTAAPPVTIHHSANRIADTIARTNAGRALDHHWTPRG